MRRRDFLKFALGAVAAAAAPLKPKAAEPPARLPWRYVVVCDYGYTGGLSYRVDDRGSYRGIFRDAMKVVDYKPYTGKHVGTIVLERISPNLSTGDVLIAL